MQLRKEYGGLIALSLTSVANAGITITDATNGLFKINQQIIDIVAFNYIYDIELDYDGLVKTYVDGNFLITNDVTR